MIRKLIIGFLSSLSGLLERPESRAARPPRSAEKIIGDLHMGAGEIVPVVVSKSPEPEETGFVLFPAAKASAGPAFYDVVVTMVEDMDRAAAADILTKVFRKSMGEAAGLPVKGLLLKDAVVMRRTTWEVAETKVAQGNEAVLRARLSGVEFSMRKHLK